MYSGWGTSNYKNYVNEYRKCIEENDMTELDLILEKMSNHTISRKSYSDIIKMRFEGNSVFSMLYRYYINCDLTGELCREVCIETTQKLPPLRMGCPVISMSRTPEESRYCIQ